ncbi:calcium-binding protein, partial [Rhizobiaceae sp. 2RAB30]
ASTSTTASRFTNTGTVEADSNGVNHYRSPETLYVDNSGVIKGGVASFISDGTSRDIVTNKGTMIGNIVLGDGNDVYDGRLGKVQGDVSGGGGNDFLYGGAENNLLNGGAGADGMYGGLGNDRFYVDNAGDRVFEAAGQG